MPNDMMANSSGFAITEDRNYDDNDYTKEANDTVSWVSYQGFLRAPPKAQKIIDKDLFTPRPHRFLKQD